MGAEKEGRRNGQAKKETARKKRSALAQDRTVDLEIMRLARCLLRYQDIFETAALHVIQDPKLRRRRTTAPARMLSD